MSKEQTLKDFEAEFRQLFPVGMRSGTDATLEFIIGFELFNTRPYHNYEDWSQGWRLTVGDVVIETEYLHELLPKYRNQRDQDGGGDE